MDNRELQVVQYDVEIWDGYTKTYIADISNIITDGLNFSWTFNDVESLDFSIDLIQFEKKCVKMGVKPEEVLTPYVHDIRLRRNGEYILGCQIVETNINIPNNSPVTVQIRCTGFLNLFKDRYITAPLSGLRTSEMAQAIIELSQSAVAPSGVVKNPTLDIDTSGWLSSVGTITHGYGSGNYGGGYIRVTRPSTSGVFDVGCQIFVPAGTLVRYNIRLRSSSSSAVYLIERQYANSSSYLNRGTITPTSTNSWRSVSGSFTTSYDNPYIFAYCSSMSGNLDVDDFWVTYYRETSRDFGVTTVNNDYYSGAIERNYSLKNAKDALLELTELGSDAIPIEFEFTPDRQFKIYQLYTMGTTNSNIVAQYPGNIESMTITRSAANLANSLLEIGSGLGNERIEYMANDSNSAATYRCRESVITNNNASILSTLKQEAEGQLEFLSKPSNLPKVVIRDGSINPGNVKIGDRINVWIDNGDTFLNSVNGVYRIVEYQVSVNLENVETVTLTLEPW